MVYQSQQASQNGNLISQQQPQSNYYPAFSLNETSTQQIPQVLMQNHQQQQPYVSKWQKLAQILNEEEEIEKSKKEQRPPKDPKDMTTADHLQVQIEEQNKKIKEQQTKMLNFVQPKVVGPQGPSKPQTVESQIPIRTDPIVNFQQGPKYIIHKVNPNDTLDRLCIIYNVPKDAIRKANDFLGDEIYMKKELIIPDSYGPVFRVNANPVVDEEARKKDMIELMHQHLREKHGKGQQISFKAEAQYYLEVTNYDFEKAMKEFEDDLKFEKEQEGKFKNHKKDKKGGLQPLLYLKK